MPRRCPDIEPKANPNDSGSLAWARAGEPPGHIYGEPCVSHPKRSMGGPGFGDFGGGGSMTQPCRLSPEESEEIALASFLFLKCPSSFP